jgi:hypothetical protein
VPQEKPANVANLPFDEIMRRALLVRANKPKKKSRPKGKLKK